MPGTFMSLQFLCLGKQRLSSSPAALLWMERSNLFYLGELPSLAMDSETIFKHGTIQKIHILVNNVLAMERQPGKAKDERALYATLNANKHAWSSS